MAENDPPKAAAAGTPSRYQRAAEAGKEFHSHTGHSHSGRDIVLSLQYLLTQQVLLESTVLHPRNQSQGGNS